MSGKIETNHKAPKFKVCDRARITKHRNIFTKGYTKHWSREMLVIYSVMKNPPCTYRIKDSKDEKVTGSFYEKEFVLEWIINELLLEPDNHIRDIVKVVLHFSSYATKKESN